MCLDYDGGCRHAWVRGVNGTITVHSVLSYPGTVSKRIMVYLFVPSGEGMTNFAPRAARGIFCPGEGDHQASSLSEELAPPRQVC